jgi:hypothetical protein
LVVAEEVIKEDNDQAKVQSQEVVVKEDEIDVDQIKEMIE